MKTTTLVEQLQAQLAASQAREEKLREALKFLSVRIVTMDLGGVVERALSTTADDTALRELIIKAGEVMREKVIEQCVAMGAMSRDGAFVEEISDLPGVTLEDLK